MNVATMRAASPQSGGDGPGKTGKVIIWQNNSASQAEYRWGLRPSEPGGRPFSLLRSEGRTIANPCLIIANDFGIRTDGRDRYRREPDH